MSDSNSTFLTLFNILNYILIFIFAVFLFIFLRIKEKTYGLLMMIILNVCYLLWPISQTIMPYVIYSEFLARFMLSLHFVTYTFALFWSASFAIFTYSVLSSKKIFNFKRFMKLAFLISFLFCLLIPVAMFKDMFGISITYYGPGQYTIRINLSDFKDKFMFLFVFDFLLTLLPVTITTYGYFRVYKILKELQQRHSTKNSPSKTFCFIIIPFICFTPGIASNVCKVLDQENTEILNYISTICHQLWGLFTLASFWFTKPAQERKDSYIDISIQTISNSSDKSICEGEYQQLKEEEK